LIANAKPCFYQKKKSVQLAPQKAIAHGFSSYGNFMGIGPPNVS